MTGETFSEPSAALPSEMLSADDVASFLTQHPDFFEDRKELLETMEIPHGGAGSISLVERQKPFSFWLFIQNFVFLLPW